jgi:hypothetical protein
VHIQGTRSNSQTLVVVVVVSVAPWRAVSTPLIPLPGSPPFVKKTNQKKNPSLLVAASVEGEKR